MKLQLSIFVFSLAVQLSYTATLCIEDNTKVMLESSLLFSVNLKTEPITIDSVEDHEITIFTFTCTNDGLASALKINYNESEQIEPNGTWTVTCKEWHKFQGNAVHVECLGVCKKTVKLLLMILI